MMQFPRTSHVAKVVMTIHLAGSWLWNSGSDAVRSFKGIRDERMSTAA